MKSLRRSVELWESLPVAQPLDLYSLACRPRPVLRSDRRRTHGALAEGDRTEREFHAERAITALRRAVASGVVPPALGLARSRLSTRSAPAMTSGHC